jgi:hypothetical protein
MFWGSDFEIYGRVSGGSEKLTEKVGFGIARTTYLPE